MAEETKVDNDPTGMYDQARRTHEMAARHGLIPNRRGRRRVKVDLPAELTGVISILDQTPADNPPIRGGWVPKKPNSPVENPVPADTELTRQVTVATRVFPSLERTIDRIKRLWPYGSNPIFDEVNADVTHPRTPTGRLKKGGPKLPYTDGLPYEEFVEHIREDLDSIPAPVIFDDV